MTVALADAPNRAEAQFEASGATRIDVTAIKKLSRIDSVRSAAHIICEWLLIIAAAVLCWRYWHPAVYVVAVAFIGARQHGLMVLAHDGAHWRLFRNRTVNDWVSELALAWPFVVLSMQMYRQNHLPHHKHINTDRDPDWVRKQTADWRFPKTRTQLVRMLILDAIGVGFAQFIIVSIGFARAASRDKRPQLPVAFRVGRLLFLVSVVTIVSVLHAWWQVLLFWLVPFVTWTQLCFHVRSIAEHFAIHGRQGVYAQTRTVIPSVFERIFVLPKHANYHLEHHLFPSVPFYRLPELHRYLMEQPEYRAGAHVTRGYVQVLRECTRG